MTMYPEVSFPSEQKHSHYRQFLKTATANFNFNEKVAVNLQQIVNPFSILITNTLYMFLVQIFMLLWLPDQLSTIQYLV